MNRSKQARRLRAAGQAMLVVLALLAPAWGKKHHDTTVDQNIATELVQMLSTGNFQGMVVHFNKDQRKEYSPAKLKQLWSAVLNEYGTFKKQLGLDAEDVPGYDIINVHCSFQYAPVIVRFVFSDHSLVDSVFFVPDTPKKNNPTT